ncbi:MAG TPA: MaoC family dehydratase N-terminal domain-containing protein [Pseudonocardia sp.]|nr:MaoC family dehydratase N-terminal domain-containing protein [Pseudonocardia sp.]
MKALENPMIDGYHRASDVRAYLTSLVGRPAHQRALARDAVTASAIRTWCDAMGERHPVYLDPASARAAGHRELVAPPGMLHVWTMPGLEPDRPLTAGPARSGDFDEIVRAKLADLGYAGTLAASIDQEFLAPLHVGERLVAEDAYVEVSAEKQTHLGPGFFLTNRTTYATTEGTTIGTLATVVFHFAPRPAAALGPPLTAPAHVPGRPAPATPVRLLAGEQCGPVTVPVTPTQIIAGALATRDFYPVHHDRDFARAHGNADFLMNSLTTNGLLARIVAEWTDQAPLLRLRTRIVAPAYAHDVLTVTGEVTEVGGGWAEVGIRAALRSGTHAEATARVGR